MPDDKTDDTGPERGRKSAPSDTSKLLRGKRGGSFIDAGPPVRLGPMCEECGDFYRVDVLVPDEIWEKIKPEGKGLNAGQLCGECIIRKLEALGFSAWKLIEV